MIKKILIVDDSPISIKIIKSCMPKDKDYELFDAADGQTGVEKYKELKPDLTFLDLTMPIMNGFQALEEILKFDQKPPAREAIAAAIKEADDALSERG